MQKPTHDIDIKLMKVFREVAKRESFSLAAESLGTSLSNISMNISQLESRLGMRLCERGVKGFRLTEQGKNVLSASDELFGAMDDYQEKISSISENMHREFRIGVLSELFIEGSLHLQNIIGGIESALPSSTFYLEFGSADDLREKVDAGELHCAFGYFDNLPKHFGSEFLYTQTHLSYCGKGHHLFDVPASKIKMTDLQSCKIAGYDDLFADEKKVIPLFSKYDSCSRTGEGILALVLTGNYIGLLVDRFAQPYVEQGLIRAIDKPQLKLLVDIEIIYRTSQSTGPTIATILKITREQHPTKGNANTSRGAT